MHRNNAGTRAPLLVLLYSSSLSQNRTRKRMLTIAHVRPLSRLAPLPLIVLFGEIINKVAVAVIRTDVAGHRRSVAPEHSVYEAHYFGVASAVRFNGLFLENLYSFSFSKTVFAIITADYGASSDGPASRAPLTVAVALLTPLPYGARLVLHATLSETSQLTS